METNSFIQHLLSNVALDSNRVIEVINEATDGSTDDLMRIMSYITGFTNKPCIPETSTIREQATLTSYNFIKNEVYFKYLESRKLKVKEAHKDLDGQIFDDWYNIPGDARSSNGDIDITIKYWCTNSCNLSCWIK